MFVDDLKKAFERRLSQEDHNIRSLARKTQVNNSTLNRLNSKKADFENIPAKTVQRLFPELRVYFFRDEYPEAGSRIRSIEVGGAVTGNIQQSFNGANIAPQKIGGSGVDIAMLSKKLRKDDRFSDAEKLKFLDFLDDHL